MSVSCRTLSLLSLLLCWTVIGLTWTPAALAQEDPPAEPTATVGGAEPGEKETVPEEEAAAESEDPLAVLTVDVNTLWTCLAAFLVFFMQAGFCLVECGFTRAKNCGNIVMKNLMDFSIGTLAFWLIGFGLMFGENATGFIGTSRFGWEEFWSKDAVSFDWAFLIFQTVFCATAATIISGAMAERTKFGSYLVYSLLITLIVYPIFGSWCWNGLVGINDTKGWLEHKGFLDFAGSTVVHSVGGWAALAGAIMVGPRIGKFVKGKVVPIPGHSLLMGALGVFILWLGWFGFNPGSTTAVEGGSFAYIAVTTNIAAAAGAVAGLVTSWLMFKKPDISFALNGALAGLVGITAGCDGVTPAGACAIGLIAGVLVVLSVLFFDKIRVDDPVGAISVHGVCGAWGTLAVGLFNTGEGLLYTGKPDQLLIQGLGVGMGFLWAFPVSLLIFAAIKYTIGLRVSEQEEIEGLDIHEHGVYAYPPQFVVDTGVGLPATAHTAREPAGSPVMAS